MLAHPKLLCNEHILQIMKYSFEALVGKTPVFEIGSLSVPHARLLVKLEGNNPGGSVKDRAALGMIRGAIEQGLLKPGGKKRIIEATSGNTGIALAMIAARMNIPATLLMPEDATPERIKIMQAYGAEVVLTPAEKTIEHSRTLAEEMAKENGWLLINQFANPHNPDFHFRTTGPEIWHDTRGQITHFISAMGTTGTITGTGRYLKRQSNKIKIIGVQPDEAGGIPGIRKWSPEFLPEIFDPSVVDQKITVSKEEATDMARYLARREGLFCGISGGGAVAAAQKLMKTLDGQAEEPYLLLAILPDRGDRYLSEQ